MFETWFLFVVLTTSSGADIEHVSTFTDQKRCEQTAEEISKKSQPGAEGIRGFCVLVGGK